MDGSAGACRHNYPGKAVIPVRTPPQGRSTPFANAQGTREAVLPDNLPKAICNISGKLDVGCENSCHLTLFSNNWLHNFSKCKQYILSEKENNVQTCHEGNE